MDADIGAKIDFPAIAEAVARALLGEPNKDLSTAKEIRWGARGSFALDLSKGVWQDHERGEGGGVLDLIRRETGRANGAALDWLRERGLADAPQPRQTDRRRIVATYDYSDEAGALLFQVCRFEPKDFRQRRPDGRGGWTWKLGDCRRVLYRLPELVAADPVHPVFIVEGEKDADQLVDLGLVATTNPGGAGKWNGAYADALAGRRVVILPDNDDTGQRHADTVLASLRGAGIAAAILALDGLPRKGDVSDWLAKGGKADDLLQRAESAIAEGIADAPTLKPTPFSWRDPSLIPPRRWLYGRHLIASFASLTVAPGGLAKSSLAIVEALAMVTDKPLLGDRPPRPLRVWIWNGEDPAEETERRIAAACLHYGVTAEDIGGRLFTDSGRETPIELARMGRDGAQIARPQVEALIAAIRENAIDVLVIDPFVTSHAVAENDNAAINAVISLWREIADRTGCAIHLIHHAQKAAINAGAEIGVAQSRGASALIDGVRSARFLLRMTEDEAGRAGVENHRTFFRVENGKANLAPPSDKATWRRLVGVDLFNGTEAYPGGDNVGVVVPWEWPDAFDGVDLTTLNAVKARLATGEWRANEQADAWAGRAVAEVLSIDAGPPEKAKRSKEQNAARARVRTMLKTWIRTGELLEVRKMDTRSRRETPFIEPAGCADE